MLEIIKTCCGWLSRRPGIVAYLTAGNLALRQQLLVLKRNQKRPKMKGRDRLFWVALSGTWSGWRDALVIVHPDTVIRWHREGFKHYWRRKSQTVKHGRPALEDLRAAARELNEKARDALQLALESAVNRRYNQALGAFQQLQMMSGGIFPPLFEWALLGAQQRATAHGNADSHVEPK